MSWFVHKNHKSLSAGARVRYGIDMSTLYECVNKRQLGLSLSLLSSIFFRFPKRDVSHRLITSSLSAEA